MQSHKDLKAWQEAMELTVELYEWLKDFPEFEKFFVNMFSSGKEKLVLDAVSLY